MKNCIRILAAAVLLSPLAGAASAQQAQPETLRKLIRIEHVDVNDVIPLVASWIKTYGSRDLRAIIVQGTPELTQRRPRFHAE